MLLSSDVFAFLRGTYYLWLVRATQEAPECFRAPRVPLVGDLHVANFGTWLDADGVARWGVNDFDELADGPYPLDLLRLATSWNLAQTKVPLREACDILWDTWRRAVPDLPAVSLSDPAHAHLERLLPLREANRYTKLEALPDAVRVPAAAIAAVSGTVPEGWAPTWHPRRAGVGSLGHPRFDGVGAGPDGRVLAREAKLLGPGACGWVAVQPECGVPTTVLPLGREACYRDVQANIAGPAVAIRLAGWQVRRLAPDVRMIDVTKLGDHADERVLRAMARATASVHGPALPAAQAHAATLPSGWLYDATRRMSASVRADHAAYVKAVPSPSAR